MAKVVNTNQGLTDVALKPRSYVQRNIGCMAYVKDPDQQAVSYTRALSRNFWITKIFVWLAPDTIEHGQPIYWRLTFGKGNPGFDEMLQSWQPIISNYYLGQPLLWMQSYDWNSKYFFTLNRFISGPDVKLGVQFFVPPIVTLQHIYVVFTISEV